MTRILVVDDEAETRSNLRKILNRKGYYTYEAENGRDALEALSRQPVEVVLLDIRMPEMDGSEALKKIKKEYLDTEVIMVTAISDLEMAVDLMKNGAYGYVTKPVDMENMTMEIEKALERRRLSIENKNYHENLERMVEEKTAGVKRLHGQLEANFYNSIRVFVELLELRDPFLGGHSRRVAFFSVETGRALGLDKARLKDLEIAGLLHDIGRLGIPDETLRKPSEDLTPGEQDLLRNQTVLAQESLKPIDELKRAGIIIRSHMERVDGAGYPDGLKGEEIPLESRILTVVNAFDEVKNRHGHFPGALYEGRTEEEAAIFYLDELSGKRFDKKAVAALKDALENLMRLREGVAAITLDEMQEGMTLAKDLLAENGKLLLAKDNKLSAALISKLRYYHKIVSPVARKIYIYSKAPPG
ncbi:MAG: HD domain-containing phosphohydrolase [Candidatus Nitrospinota bacterium M3_3B_026]